MSEPEKYAKLRSNTKCHILCDSLYKMFQIHKNPERRDKEYTMWQLLRSDYEDTYRIMWFLPV